jgi:hypothetical protein
MAPGHGTRPPRISRRTDQCPARPSPVTDPPGARARGEDHAARPDRPGAGGLRAASVRPDSHRIPYGPGPANRTATAPRTGPEGAPETRSRGRSRSRCRWYVMAAPRSHTGPERDDGIAPASSSPGVVRRDWEQRLGPPTMYAPPGRPTPASTDVLRALRGPGGAECTGSFPTPRARPRGRRPAYCWAAPPVAHRRSIGRPPPVKATESGVRRGARGMARRPVFRRATARGSRLGPCDRPGQLWQRRGRPSIARAGVSPAPERGRELDDNRALRTASRWAGRAPVGPFSSPPTGVAAARRLHTRADGPARRATRGPSGVFRGTEPGPADARGRPFATPATPRPLALRVRPRDPGSSVLVAPTSSSAPDRRRRSKSLPDAPGLAPDAAWHVLSRRIEARACPQVRPELLPPRSPVRL